MLYISEFSCCSDPVAPSSAAVVLRDWHIRARVGVPRTRTREWRALLGVADSALCVDGRAARAGTGARSERRGLHQHLTRACTRLGTRLLLARHHNYRICRVARLRGLGCGTGRQGHSTLQLGRVQGGGQGPQTLLAQTDDQICARILSVFGLWIIESIPVCQFVHINGIMFSYLLHV
jgi:hypothetical protein